MMIRSTVRPPPIEGIDLSVPARLVDAFDPVLFRNVVPRAPPSEDGGPTGRRGSKGNDLIVFPTVETVECGSVVRAEVFEDVDVSESDDGVGSDLSKTCERG